MISIVGGAYFEYCHFPSWDELFGSGLRAAIALSSISKNISLHTISSTKSEFILNVYKSQFNIEIHSIKSYKSISFSYLHPLANPYVSFQTSKKEKLPIIKLEAENILKFGMIDALSIVAGKNVVYDPQSPLNPQLFDENGSTAKNLVYICNLKEAQKLTNNSDVIKAGKTLLKFKFVVASIIKCDIRGTYVFVGKDYLYLPPFETKRVWPIGSGDIFSAVFTHFWCEKNLSIFESAKKASLYTAFYCENKILPLPTNLISSYSFKPIPSKIKSLKINGQIYLAGAFFNIQELWLINEVRNIFTSKKIKVFSPYHNVGIGPAAKVAKKDLIALKRSQLLFALLDNLDTGTVFEIGYARALGIPVFGFSQNYENNNFAMLNGTDCNIYNDFSTAIYKCIWEFAKL